MAYFIKRHLGVWAVLFSCVLLAAFLSADSAGKNNANSARGFLYSEYLSGGGRVAAVAGGGFTVENRGGFWARGGEIFSAATARATDFPVGHWILDYAMEDADILRRLRGRAVAEWLATGDLLAESALFAATEELREDGIIRTLEFDVQSALGGRFANIGLSALGALREREDDAVAWQLRGYAGREGRGGNIGLIYRRALAAGGLLGANAFLDLERAESEENYLRWSVGGEFRSPWLDSFVNYYDAITDPVVRRSQGEYTASGYDIEINIHAPDYPWLAATGGYYFWQGELGDEDEDGFRAGIKLTPRGLPLELEVEYEFDAEDGKNWGGQISYYHELGKLGGRTHGSVGEFNARDWFFAPAEREYTQRIRNATESGVKMTPLSLVGGNAEYSNHQMTITLTPPITQTVSLPPPVRGFPTTLETLGNAVIALSINASGASGSVRIGSTVVFYVNSTNRRGVPVMELREGVIRLAKETGVWNIETMGRSVTVVVLERDETASETASVTVSVAAGAMPSVGITDGRVSLILPPDPTSTSTISISREINCTSDAGTVGGIRFSQSCPFIFLIENAFAEVIRGAPPGAPLVTVMASGGGGAASYTYSLENAPAELMIESTIGMGILRHTAIFSELTTASFDIVAASGTETARATFTVEVVLPSPVGLDVQPAAAQITVAVESGILATAAASGGLGSDSYEYTLADNPPQITINATSGIIGFSAPFTVLNSVQALNITNFNIIVESRSSLMPRGEGQLATVSFRTEVVSPEDLALRVEPVAVQITAGVASGILATARASGGLGTASYVYSLGEEPPQVAIDAASGEISFNAPFVLNAERALNITNFNVIVESTSTIVLSGIRQFATVSFRTETLPEELEISVTPDDTTVRTSIAVGVIAEAAVLGGRPPYRYSLDNAPAQIGIGGDSAAATVSLVSEFTTTLTYTVGVVVRDSDNLLATATLMFRTVNEAGLDIMPTMVRATAGFPVPRDLASAQVLGGEVGVNYTYGLTEVNNAPARLELDADADGGTVRLTSTYLLAEVGNQEYRITANGDNDPTLQFTMTLTVAVQPTPELNLNLSEDSVRLPVGVGNRELSRATASGGLGSGYTYSITRNGLPSDLGIDSTSGVIRYNGLAALDGGGNAPQGSADIIVASGELRTTMALAFSVWDITVNNAAAEVRDRESVGGNILPTIMIINPQGRTYNYGVERIGGGNTPSISADGEITAPSGGFGLADLRVREIITLRLTATDRDTSGGVATKTAEITVLPRQLSLFYEAYTAPSPADGAGVILGSLRAENGEGAGDYTYSLISTNLSVAVNAASGIVSASGVLGEITITQQFVATLNGVGATVQVSYAIATVASVSVAADEILLTTGVAGAIATATITGIPAAENGEYRFSLNDSASLSEFGNYSIDGNSGELRLDSALSQAGSGEFLVQAVHQTALRTVVVTVSVRVVDVLALALPVSATVLAEVVSGFLATAVASGGNGNYTYRIENAPSQVAIDASSGVISHVVFPLPQGPNSFAVIVDDGEGRSATRQFAITVAPASLRIELTPTSAAVRTSISVGDISTATAAGGRPPLIFSLDSPPPQVEINETSGVIRLVSEFAVTGAFTIPVVVSDADSRQVRTNLALRVIDEPGLDIAPSSVLATAGFPAKILATAIVRGGESGVVYAYTLTPKNNAPARLELDSGGGAVRSVTPFLLAEIGTHEYRINANQNGGTLAFTANLTVAVSTTPALILELTETEVRIPEGTPAGIISAVRAATGGLGSGYTYSLDTGSLPSGILGINAAGEVRLSAAAAVASGGNGPHENVEVIAASGELRTTMTLLYSVWGAELLRSGAEVRDRRDVAGSTLPDINIRNERGRNYNYAAERIGGGEAPSISADGEIIAPGGGFVLPDPRARTTLTLRLTATDTNTSGGEATVTAEIIVRPRVLGIAYTRVVAPKLGDQPGVIIGRLVASDGEGLVADYQFSHDGTFPLSLDMQGATARIILAAEITAAIPQIQRGFTVELGGESADTSQLLFASDRITLSVAPILLTTGDTGMVATATIINRAPEPLSDYDFSLNDSASFGGFGNFSIDSASGVLRVSPGIAQAERGEIEVRAVYPEARRTLVAMVQVSVVAPIQLNVVPDTATVTALAQDNSIIVQANAAGGSGGYDYSFGTAPSAPPANIGIDGSSGAITLLSPFSVPGEHSFEVVVLDNESRRATETAIITVAPAPLELQAAETAFSVRITATSGEFITLGVVGGRSPYLYSLDGEPAGLLIDEDRIIHHQSAFLAAGEFPFRAIVTDADSESATVHLTLTVFLNPEVNIAPASVQITAGVTSTVLAAASIDNGGAGVSYTYSVLPVAGAPGGRLQVDGGGGNINLTSHYLTVEANTHQYNVEATGGGETFTATLTVLVIAPPPLIIDLAPTFFRVGAGGTPAGVVARATGTGGIGGYTYRFSQIPGDISGLLGIDSNNGEIRLLADGDFVRTNSGGIRTIDTPAMVEVASGGELRTRARFDFSIWGVNLLNPNIEVRNGDEYRFNSGSSRFGFSLHNGRNGGTVAYTCSATRSDGKATAIFRCGESSAVVQFRTPDLFTLPDPRVRATVTINLSMTERQAPFSVARATGFFTVRPDELNFSTGDKITNPAVGEGAGIVVAKLRATRGEGPIDGYQFTYSGSLPLSLDVQEDSADVILNGVLSAEAADSVHTFTVVQGPETRTQELSFAVGPGITLSVAAVLLTMGDTVPVATAAIINLPASDETGDYDFSLTDSASFAGFGNFSIAENGGILQVDTAFSAATTGEIEVRAVYPEARRTLVATVQINVVEPLVLEVSPASVIIAADVAAGNVAAASATGGEGAYTYSLENIPPEQLQIIPASGEIRVTAGFPDPGEITISIAVADGESRTAAAELILTITPAPLAINVSQPGFVPTGLVAEITRATVSGGRPPFTWTLQGNPPAQLAVSGSGRIVAVETAVAFTAIGTHSFSVQVVDADNETASVPLTASVVVAAALNISPASADVTAGITGLTLAQVTLVGNRENYTYVFTFTPVGNAPANLQLAEDANNAGRILLSSAYLRADVGTTHNYRIVADATAAGGTVFTVTLAVGVIDTPAIQLNLSHSSRIFQRGRGPGEITRATASGGLGADVGYIYRFGGTGNLPSGVLEINSANGAIDLLAAATVFADGSGPHENVEIIAESGERRSTITFLYSVWDITVVRATAEVRHQTEIPLGILPDINVINQQGRAYTFGVKNDTGGGSPPVRIATDGRLFAQNLAAVSSSHPLIVDGGRFILDNPRARYTAILRVSATDTNNVGLMATAAIVVRPPPVGLNLEVLTHPAVGEAPGVLLGRLTATGGEGLISDYQFSFVSNALPLTLIHLDNVAEIMLTAAVTTPVSFNPFSFSVAQGGETASSPAIINAGQPIAVSVAPVLLTTNNSGAVATATIINRPGVDPLSLYDFSLHNPANFSGFSNFSINTASGVLQVAAFSAAAAGEIEVRAIYPEARRTLVATVQISVVAPIELNVAPATARTTANVGSGILATATATGGGGNYAYGLVNTPPAQVAINPANGEIRFNAAFPQPTEFTISISVNDGESRIAAAELMLIIAPEELVINVTPGVVTVPTRLTSTIIATAVISGGRMPFITSLQGAPTQVVLNDGGTSIQDSGGTVTVVITAIFTQSAAHIFSVRVQDADGNFRTAAMTVSVVAGPEVGISPSATAPVTAGITGIEIAQAIVTGNRNGLTYTYGITPQAGAPAKLQLATGGGAVRVDSAYLLAEVGNHNYEIIADTAGGESLTSTLTVQVITTPPVILDLSQDSVRLPAASTGEIIGAGAASGGLGSGYVYSLASGPQLAGVFAIDSASGAVNLAAAASVYADGSGPHEDVTVIAQSGEVSATATFLYSIWDVTLNKPSAEVRHQTPPASDLLPSVIIINRQSDAFNNNAIASPGGVGYDNANNRFTAPSGGFVLPNPRLRITLTVSRGIVNTSVPGTIMVTAEIVVRPPPLRIQIDNYADRNRFAARPAISDSLGVVFASLSATGGEGVGNYVFSTRDASIGSNNVIGISGNLAVLTASVTQTTGRHALFYGVRLGTEQVENPTRYLYPHAPALRLTTRNIVVTVGVQSGPVATLGIENIDNRGDVSHYNYSLRNPSNLSEFGKIAISSIIVPIPGFVGSMTVFFLQLTAPLENVTVSEIEVVAVHPQVRRTLVATVRVRALAPLGINIAPEDSTATLLALELPDNNLFDVTVSGGSTPYTVSLLNAPAEVTLKETLVTVARAGAAVDITITTYQISLASAFAQPGEHVFNLTVRDDGRQRSAQRLSQRFVITVTPLPFTISLSQDSAAVRLTTAASAPFVLGTMTATGGRPPYVYQIDNNFFGALSVNADGVIQQINSILPPRQHAFRVFVRDADGREMVRDYVIRSLDEPQVRVRMLNSRNFFNLGDIRLTAGVEHGVIATVEFMDRYAGVRYTQSIIPVGNAPPGVFDIVPGDGNIIGNGINLASVFLNAQAGRHQYTIAVAGDDGRTYVRAMNVLVVPTPPLQVLVPAGFGSARVRYDMLTVLATLSVSGGTGVNTYRIERNGAPPQLTVNAATGEIIMNPGAQFANEATATIIVESGELQQAVPFTVAVWGFQVWSEGDTRPVRAVRAAIPEISGVAGQEPAFSDFIGDAVNGIGAYPTGMERTDGRPHVRDTHWSISGSGSGIRRIRLRSAFFTLADPSNAEERVTMRIIAGPSGEDEIDHITVVARIVAGAFPEIHIQGESPLTQGDAAGSVFGTLRVRNVAAANTDVSDNYTYSIASRDDGNLPLGVDATSGVITVSAPLRTGVLRVNFVAEETTDNTRITLERDIAVLPPPPVVVILGETGIAAGSGVVGAIIGTVRASIFGGETEPRGDYSYSLTGGSGQLGVDESSGIISVIAAATTGNVLAFTVIAVHRGTGVRATLSRSITVDTPPILALTGANQLRDGIASLGRLRIISSVSNVDISSNWENFSVAIRGSGGPAGDLPIAVDATTGDVVVISTAVLVEGNNWNVRFTAEERIGVGVMTLDLDFEVLPPLPRLLIIGARDLQERADSIGAVFGTLRVSIAASGNLDGSADYTYSLANRGGGDLPLGVNADSGVVSVTADLSPGRLLVNFVAAARSGGETLTISRNISVLPSRLALAWTPGRFVIQGDPVGAIIGTLGVSGGAGIISGSTTPSLLGVSETGVVTVAAAIPNGNPISGTFMVEDAATGVGVTLNVQFTVFVPELTYFVPGAGGTQVRELRQDDYPGRFIGQLLFKITIIQTETAADGTTTTATVFVFPQTSNIRYSVADRNGLFGGNLGPFPLGINENNGALTIAHIIRDSISNLPLEFVAVAESGGVTTTITLNHDLPVGNSQTQRLGLTYTGATVINFSDAPGTIVGTLQATLSDVVNVNYRYYHDDVLSFGQRTLLAVDEFSGVVSIAESELNDGTAPNLADTVSVFVAGFRVEEPGNNALRLGYATVTVAVNPQLILAPAFTAVGFGANDNSAGITLATAAVAGVANTAAYTYSIVGIDSAPAGHLAISVSGGTIGIVITAAYDAAANAGVYEYRINASAGNKTASATLTVNVLNSAQLVYLPRRAPQNSDTVGQVIGTLSVIGSFPTVTNSVGPDRFVASALSFQAGEPFPFGVDETTGIMSVTVSSLSAYTVPIFVNFAVERILTVSVSQTTPQATMTIALSQVRQLFDFSATPPPPPQFTAEYDEGLAPANGQSAGMILATVRAAGGLPGTTRFFVNPSTITITMITGNGDTVTQTVTQVLPFGVDETSGVVSLSEALSGRTSQIVAAFSAVRTAPITTTSYLLVGAVTTIMTTDASRGVLVTSVTGGSLMATTLTATANITARISRTFGFAVSAELTYTEGKAPVASDAPGTILGTLSATGGGAGDFAYSIRESAPGFAPFPLGVDETTGVVSVIIALDPATYFFFSSEFSVEKHNVVETVVLTFDRDADVYVQVSSTVTLVTGRDTIVTIFALLFAQADGASPEGENYGLALNDFAFPDGIFSAIKTAQTAPAAPPVFAAADGWHYPAQKHRRRRGRAPPH